MQAIVLKLIKPAKLFQKFIYKSNEVEALSVELLQLFIHH
jgi:hypothetical protein